MSTNQEVFRGALSVLGEPDGNYCDDYEERAPYLIATFCSMTKDIDKGIRLIEGLEAGVKFSPVYLSLSDDFPLCDSLVPCASLYVAAMLVIDEDPELSDSIYEKYCDAISDLSAYVAASSSADKDDVEIASCESIAERYFFN